MPSPDYSPEFYRLHADRYAQVVRQFLQSVYTHSSHPRLKNDWRCPAPPDRAGSGQAWAGDAGCGTGVATVSDKDYGMDRTFPLYDEHHLLAILQRLGLALVKAQSPEELGNLLYFTDTKRPDHCLFFARKDAGGR